MIVVAGKGIVNGPFKFHSLNGEVLSRPVDQDLLRDHDLGVIVGRPFD
jgi:hypothetical protein